MRLQGIPFWLERGDNGTTPLMTRDDDVTRASSSSATTTTFPSLVSCNKSTTEVNCPKQFNVNEKYQNLKSGNQSNKSLIPPLLPSKLYGAIDIPPAGRINSVNEDSEDENQDWAGFPSVAGWSTRMTRRSSSIKSNSCCLQYLGIILTIWHAVFTSLSGLTVKLLENEYHAYNICFWRFSTIFFMSILIILYTKLFTKIKLWPRPLVEEKNEHLKNVMLLLLRGILGCAGRILLIISITCMTLSDAMVIAASSPVFMNFFAYFLLGESCGVVPIVVALITLIGVGIITRPPWLTGGGSYNQNILVGTGAGFSGMILTTLVMVVMRKLRQVNVTLITLSFASWGAVVALILSLYHGVLVVPTDNLTHALLLIASGATSFFGQTFLTLGLKYESAGVVALLTNFAVVFSFIFEYIFLHIVPDVFSISGGFIVIFCIVIVTFRKWIGTLPEYHEVRQIFSFLLL